jgi:hypothetical protein
LTGIGVDSVILPGPLAVPLTEAGHSVRGVGSPDVIAVWRSPERAALGAPWRESEARLTDVLVFGETGLIAACRGAGGKSVAIPFGIVSAPRAPKGSIIAAEIAPTADGTVAMRGTMVPRAPFPPGAERSCLPRFRVAASGFMDTGYPCRADTGTMLLTGPPPGIVSVGGYRFVMEELQGIVDRAECGEARLGALPHPLAGYRLTASASDRNALEVALAAQGANPLLVGALQAAE